MHENYARPSRRTKAPKDVLLPILPPFFIQEHAHALAHDPDSTPQQTEAQTFSTKNYDGNTRLADRDFRGIFCTPTDVFALPLATLVGPLGSSSFTTQTLERILEEMESSDAGSTLGTLGLGTCASAANPTQHEVLQSFFKSSLNHGGRPAGTDAAAGMQFIGEEDVRRRHRRLVLVMRAQAGFANRSSCRRQVGEWV